MGKDKTPEKFEKFHFRIYLYINSPLRNTMKWILKSPHLDLVADIAQDFRCSKAIATVLASRNFTSVEESRAFFDPDLSALHDPFLMLDMKKSVERIAQNIQSKTPILVFGDYDVDGTTAASLLTMALSAMGASVLPYIPSRENEGYGLSVEGLNFAVRHGADLVITCDCGINAFKQVDEANKLGLDVIITDHHVQDTTLPEAFAILNPNRNDCDYPFKGLCGGGVAFKLALAVAKHLEKPLDIVYDLLELVTLGTSADMVPIVDENRILVTHGLRQIGFSKRPGIVALMEQAKLNGKIPSVGQLVFGMAPKINAAGRLGDANRAVELFTTLDTRRAGELALELTKENTRRQEIQAQVVDEAMEMAKKTVDLHQDKAIVLAQKGWHPGVLGIVASKIKEGFNRPAIVISIDSDGLGKGSARSIKGLDLYQALTKTKQYLDGYGGHPMAAGVTVKESNLEAFSSAFIIEANRQLTPEDLEPKIFLDAAIGVTDVDTRFMDFLFKLGPYGPGNMRPKFVVKGAKVEGVPSLIGNGNHLRFRIKEAGRVLACVGFNQAQHYEKLVKGIPVDLACVIEMNEWNGRSTIQLNVRDIKLYSD